MKITKEILSDFENDIATKFEKGMIRAGIHLSDGCEDALMDIFKNINPGDWIFSTHRSHMHYLLATGNPDKLQKMILNGDSMHIYDASVPFFTSAIVAGICPIALGVALSIKRNNGANRVWTFIGDMAVECGITMECIKYASKNNLPITFVVEDNGMSVDTPTQEAWGSGTSDCVIRYKYQRKKFPHSGTGKWITL